MAEKAKDLQGIVMRAELGDLEALELLGQITQGMGILIREMEPSAESSQDLEIPLAIRLGSLSLGKKRKKKQRLI